MVKYNNDTVTEIHGTSEVENGGFIGVGKISFAIVLVPITFGGIGIKLLMYHRFRLHFLRIE